MKHKLLRAAAPVSLLLFAASAFPRQSGQQVRANSPFTELTFEISSPKTELVQFEPLPLTLRVTNRTANTIVAHDFFLLGTDYLELYVVGRNGQRRKVKNLSNTSLLAAPQRVVLGPGGGWGGTRLVTLGLEEMFPRPGRYTLQLVFHHLDPGEKVTSNLMTIDVKEPLGEDAEAVRFIRENAKLSNFFTSVYASNQEAAEAFVSKYADTAYGDYVVFMLGEYYFYRDEFAEALKQFVKLAGKREFVFANRAADYVEKLRAQSGRTPGNNPPGSP